MFSGRYLPEYGLFRTLRTSWILHDWSEDGETAKEQNGSCYCSAVLACQSFFFSSHRVGKDEGQILIPALTQWSFHSPASLQKQLISAGLPSLCQLLISGPPHLSLLQPLNLRLLPSQPRSHRAASLLVGDTQYRADTAESDISWGEAPYAESSELVRLSGGTEQRFCAAAA